MKTRQAPAGRHVRVMPLRRSCSFCFGNSINISPLRGFGPRSHGLIQWQFSVPTASHVQLQRSAMFIDDDDENPTSPSGAACSRHAAPTELFLLLREFYKHFASPGLWTPLTRLNSMAVLGSY